MNKTWYPAYISLGSNLQNPRQQLDQALLSVAKLSEVKIVAVSSYYQTEPYGGVVQDDFVNAVAALLTRLSPEVLLEKLLAIETKQGRIRKQHWGPRCIDLDLLAYAREQRDSEFLQLPHPEISKRDFVLVPFAEIAPQLLVPGLGRITRLCAELAPGKIIKLEKN